ncbi:phage tail protein [Acinetobacter ursingii]|uniref:phage tail protein n=1 Tax=Acinetobacter ursingii TaxID=108980 RepID=UPI0012507382|nr:phage tail protein [Acinetobacter ursingii]
MAKKKKQTIGYKYFASGHFVLCHGPIDAITKISFQDKDAYLNEENSNKTIYINKPSLFGGDEQSGGVQGNIELLFGRADQQKSSTLQRICAKISNAFGGLISAYRGVCSVVFDNVYIGTAPNMPDSKWRVKRIHTRHDGQVQWYDEKAEIFSPIQGDSVAYNFDRLSWDLVGDPNTVNQDGAIYCDFKSDTQFTVYSSAYGSDKVFDIFVNVTAKTELNGVSGGEAVDGYEWISKGGVYTNPLVNEYKIIISDPPQTYLLNKGTFEIPYEETERFARLKLQVKNGGTIRCVCDTIDKYMATGKNGATNQYMHFDAASSVDQDINPAHIIRECLTNQVWGIGVSESNIDDVSFKNAADKLYFEKMGMSIKWTDSTSINEFVDNIKEHINAQLYLDRVTNKWKLYLIRDDYDIADLISLNESNIRNLDFERRTLAECVNSVTVTYWDRERAKDSTVTVQDIARIAQQGGVISQPIDYKGFTNNDLASRIALRDLKTLSSTLASVSFDVDESFSESWHEGMPFKLSDSSYGLSEAVMRIRTIKRGDGINNTVYVEAIEDSFSSPMQSVIEYVPPVTSGDSTAKNATSIAFEVPYIELVEQYGQDAVDAKLSNYPELGYVGMAAIRPNNQHINASLYVNAGAGYDERTTLDFCPNASLKNDIGYMDSSFEVENVAEFELLEANHRIQINDEIMAFVGFDSATNIITVKRGCFDTGPQEHAAGSKIFGWDNYSGIDDLEYLSGENISLKALTLTGSDVLELNEATTHSLTLSSRAIRPYPPANVKINGEYYPAEIDTDLILTWVDRNRVQQTGGSILGWTDGGVTIESGTSTMLTIKELDLDDLVVAKHNINVTGTNTYTLAISAMQADTRFVEVTLKTVRDGYESYQAFDYAVELSQFFSAPYDLTVEFKK